MKLNSLQLSTNGCIGNVILNGEDISNKISGIEYVHNAGEVPFVKITYPLDEVNIDADAEIKQDIKND